MAQPIEVSEQIANAILAINPKAGCKILGEDINNITWLDETDPISNEDIIDKQSIKPYI